jgi:hypothetical protein
MEVSRVNGEAHEAGNGRKTGGKLLAAREHGDGVSRKVVAVLRFSGVDQPTCRQPEMLP